MSTRADDEAAVPPAQVARLLNGARLRLAPGLRVAKLSAERVAVKAADTDRILVATPRQWELLQSFRGEGEVVPRLLTDLIREQRCPPLGEFYELLVRAAQAGVLLSDAVPPPAPVRPAAWPLKLPGAVVRWLALAALAGLVVSVALRPAGLPEHAGWLVAGWLAGVATVSAGWVLAASVVRAAGGDVYAPRFEWRAFAPGFRAVLSDVLLGGARLRADAALARLLPLALAGIVAAWRLPALLVPLGLFLLLELSPLWPTPVQELLAARFRDPRLAVTFGLELARSRLFTLLLHLRRQWKERTYLCACAVATAVWLAAVAATGALLLHANAADLWRRFHGAGGLHLTALALAGLLGALVLTVVGFLLAGLWRHVADWQRERTERRLRPMLVKESVNKIAEWLVGTLLFRGLPVEELLAAAAAARVEEHRSGSYVVREGEPGDRLYIVLGGRLEIRRDYAPGRSEAVAQVGPGEIFGEIALLQGGVRTRSVRAVEPSTLLSLSREDFERTVLKHLSREAVLDEIQKIGFLQQAELTRGWSPAALKAFAAGAKFQEIPEGGVFLRAGQRNHWFFLVHRGELAVEVDGRELRRLRQGDSFGELSLLGDGVATSTVVVRSKVASCLVVPGADFLGFVTRDFAAGLKWEQLRVRRREPGARR